MKKYHLIYLVLVFALMNWPDAVLGQNSSKQAIIDSTVVYQILKTDGTILRGKILESDEMNLRIEALDGRIFLLPQHLVQRLISPHNQVFIGQEGDSLAERFANRGFLASNALPIKKGEHYGMISMYGPGINFVPFDQFEIGFQTSWITAPFVVTLKYNVRIGRRSSIGINVYGGTGHLVVPKRNAGLSNIGYTYGNRMNNVSINGGFGVIEDGHTFDYRPTTGFNGMLRVRPRLSLVLESVILLTGKRRSIENTTNVYNSQTGQFEQITTIRLGREKPPSGYVVLGFRLHQHYNSAFQFGFSMIHDSKRWLPIPIPMVQWFTSF